MQPDRVFDFEPAEARELHWLPLAVRYKLDACGRKIGLKEWQALALEQREVLVRCPAGPLFEQQLVQMVPAARKPGGTGLQAAPMFHEYLAARIPA